jgi:hypothetical protein
MGQELLHERVLRLTSEVARPVGAAAVATETAWAVGSDVAVVAVVLVRNAQAVMAAVSALGVVGVVAAVAVVAVVASFVFLITLAVEAIVAVVVVTLNCVYKAWTSLSKELIKSL